VEPSILAWVYYIENKIVGQSESVRTSDQFKERYQPLDERKKQLAEEIPKAEADLSLVKIDGLSRDYIVEEAQDLYACWPKMNTEERRRIVETLVQRITISKDEIDISLCYLPFLSGNTSWGSLPHRSIPCQGKRLSRQAKNNRRSHSQTTARFGTPTGRRGEDHRLQSNEPRQLGKGAHQTPDQ
jgi:hypothetical protein